MNETSKETIRSAQTSAGAGILVGAIDQEARAKMLTDLHTVEGGRSYRISADGTPVTMEAWMSQPTAMRGEVELHDALSFSQYVTRFKNNHSIVFADERASRFTAVLDYHEAQGSPRWLRNRAFLQLVHTPEWKEWIALDEKPQAQAEFAQFLEDHIPDIGEPAGATLVEIARNLEATTSGRFQSAIRANDGSINFAWTKEVQAQASGSVKIPTEVTLMLKPYESLPDRYQVTGKLRYRITSGMLTLWFDLFGVDEALEEAFGNIREDINAKVATTVLAGPAPKQQTAE